MPDYLRRCRRIEEFIDKQKEVEVPFDVKKLLHEPYQRWCEELECSPDDLGDLEEKFRKRLNEYKRDQLRDRGWVCEYCGSTQPPMDSHCRECGAPRR